MLTDTPLQSSGQAIGRLTGVVAALVGFALAKSIIAALTGVAIAFDARFFLQLGLVVVLGLLFATSHNRTSRSADIAIGLSFGIMTWVGANVLVPFAGWSVSMRDIPHFLGGAAFGLTLGVAALVFKQATSSIQPLAD